MSFEENLKNINKSLERLDDKELGLDKSVKTYKERLKSIEKARPAPEKAKLEMG